MVASLVLGFAILCCVAGYAFYGLAIRRELVQPSRASWLIWSTTTGIEALTYQAVNAGAAQNIYFLISTACCLLVTAAIWKHSSWQRPSTTDSICMAICLAAVILWIGFENAWWAHVVALVAIPISFIPTWASIRINREHENSPAWGLWAIGDVAILAAIGGAASPAASEIPYAMLEFACHASIWILVGLSSINPMRTMRWIQGSIATIEFDAKSRLRFFIGRNSKGKAVFAGQKMLSGSKLILFTGPVYEKSFLPSDLDQVSDRFLQIEHRFFMGPSHGIDDLINHSCNPNCGLTFAADGVALIALRDIPKGEEITWDYSTTSLDHGWSMQCYCEMPQCRRIVGDFHRRV